MCIACGIISVIFCATAWIMTANKNRNANRASIAHWHLWQLHFLWNTEWY